MALNDEVLEIIDSHFRDELVDGLQLSEDGFVYLGKPYTPGEGVGDPSERIQTRITISDYTQKDIMLFASSAQANPSGIPIKAGDVEIRVQPVAGFNDPDNIPTEVSIVSASGGVYVANQILPKRIGSTLLMFICQCSKAAI